MLASDVIKELQKRIEIYGDCEVIFRDENDDSDIDILSVYADDEAERIIVSNSFDFIGE